MTFEFNTANVLDVALAYAGKSIPVFPCNPADKTPLTGHGFKDATADPAIIRKLWARHEGAAIGIPTGKESGLVVVDLDDYKANFDQAAWHEIQEKIGGLPDTLTQRTGGGGRQYFFKHPGGDCRSKNGFIPGADFKADGGYVLAPPSRHPSGGTYKWIKKVSPAPLPGGLLDLIHGKKETIAPPPRPFTGNTDAYADRALEAEVNLVMAAPEGTRNDTLNRAAFSLGQLVAGGELDHGAVEGELFAAAAAAGLNQAEARKTIRSGLKSGGGSPRTAPESSFTGGNAADEGEKHAATPERPLPGSEPIPLPDELSPVMPFDYELLPESLRAWIKDISERMQCPPDFVAVTVMAAMAAVIGRKVGIRPQARTDWTVVCNLWALIVGRPGVLKSPAQEAGLSPLKRLIATANERHKEQVEAHEGQALAAKLKKEAAEKKAKDLLRKDPSADLNTVLAVGEEPVFPVLKRYQANDSTPASLGELLRQNPNGLLVFRDEVVSLLKSLDREGQEEGRGFYLTAWNGDSPYTFDRIGRGLNLSIPALCISLLGGTQPGRLSEYITQAVKGGSADDGLIQRFGLIVWPDMNGKWSNVDEYPDTEAKNRAFQVFDELDRLNPLEIGAAQDTDHNGDPEGIPYLRFDPAALELFTEWRTALESKLRSDLHPALESHYAKYRKLIPSLALILHLADGGTGPVSENATLRALAWGEYLETHAERAYSSVSRSNVSTAKAILHRIKKGDLKTPFTSHAVWRPGWSKLSDRDQVMGGLRMLEDYNHIFIEKVETGGRAKTLYHLNKGE